MSTQFMKALCCTCGSVRECRRPRNHRAENYWLRRPVDLDWHRETGELKCAECGRVTVHAIITGDDHAEKIRLAATGWTYKELDDAGHQRIQRLWREGMPRNPNTRHLWWLSNERKAREAGRTHFSAICMAEVEMPGRPTEERGSFYKADEMVAPDRLRDVDREDLETGLWWFDVDCVDCLYRWNMIALENQREALKERVLELVGKLDNLDAPTVAALLANFTDAE